jgi:hypothetical protein
MRREQLGNHSKMLKCRSQASYAQSLRKEMAMRLEEVVM